MYFIQVTLLWPDYSTLPFPLPLSRQSKEKLNTYLKGSLNNTQYKVETNYELLNIKHDFLFFYFKLRE